MKITLVISSLSSGGAERVMSIIANYWAERNDEITLITIDSVDKDFYQLDKTIQRVALDLKEESTSKWNAFKNNLHRVRRLRYEVKRSQPEVIISFLDRLNVLTLIATKGLSVPIIVSEHIDPRQLPPNGIWKPLRRWSYLWASAVLVLTAELKSVLSEFVPENRLYVIPNPAIVVNRHIDATLPFELPSPFVVAIGRLKPQKGFDLLLEAFSLCQHKTWSLVLLGEGPERERLESTIRRNGLQSRVFLPGRIKEPSVVLQQADLYVMSSRFEGFPMVILEAMSCGLPVVSFDCPTGPSDIITDGVDGVLVPPLNVVNLADTMDRLMEDKNERQSLALHARDVVKKFSISKVMGQWDSLLSKVTS